MGAGLLTKSVSTKSMQLAMGIAGLQRRVRGGRRPCGRPLRRHRSAQPRCPQEGVDCLHCPARHAVVMRESVAGAPR
eukprot:6407909-Lingulodinium_polyedra.AAC.1